MKTVKGYIYTYAISYDGEEVHYKISDTEGMDSQEWLLIDEREISVEVEDIDYTGLIKQNKIDAVMAKQEAINAELLELTANAN